MFKEDLFYGLLHSKSRTCISELRHDFFDRSVSNHISQPSSGNLAAQNALRRLVEREKKGSHTLPPPSGGFSIIHPHISRCICRHDLCVAAYRSTIRFIVAAKRHLRGRQNHVAYRPYYVYVLRTTQNIEIFFLT